MQLEVKTTAPVLIDLQQGVLRRPVQPYAVAHLYARSKQLVQVRVSFAKPRLARITTAEGITLK